MNSLTLFILFYLKSSHGNEPKMSNVQRPLAPEHEPGSLCSVRSSGRLPEQQGMDVAQSLPCPCQETFISSAQSPCCASSLSPSSAAGLSQFIANSSRPCCCHPTAAPLSLPDDSLPPGSSGQRVGSKALPCCRGEIEQQLTRRAPTAASNPLFPSSNLPSAPVLLLTKLQRRKKL